VDQPVLDSLLQLAGITKIVKLAQNVIQTVYIFEMVENRLVEIFGQGSLLEQIGGLGLQDPVDNEWKKV